MDDLSIQEYIYNTKCFWCYVNPYREIHYTTNFGKATNGGGRKRVKKTHYHNERKRNRVSCNTNGKNLLVSKNPLLVNCFNCRVGYDARRKKSVWYTQVWRNVSQIKRLLGFA